jgi:protease I
MDSDLQSMRIAILAGDSVDQDEVLEPWTELQEAGAEVEIISSRPGQLTTRRGEWPGARISVDADVRRASVADFDGLVIVGDYISTESLRSNPLTAALVREFFRQGKLVAALDHGASLVLEAEHIYGRQLTCADSLKEDVDYAGGHWQDRPVVRDGNLLTGHRRDDAMGLTRELLRALRRKRRADRTRQRLGKIRRRADAWWRKLLHKRSHAAPGG